MRARRVPCLTHPKTTPEEPVDAATRRVWLKLSRDPILTHDRTSPGPCTPLASELARDRSVSPTRRNCQ